MKQPEMLSLIEGRFSAEEAQEILMNIYSTKIHFHELKNFSSIERFGKPDKTAQKRIPKLKKEVEKLTKMISKAKLKNKQLIISSEINIQFSDA